jgi:tetratricopeptide (TPR) repeat protein
LADQSAKKLLQQAINATRKRDLPAARKLIQASIRKDPKSETAWLVFASIAESKRDQLICLKKVLEINPVNQQALKMVADLGVDPEKLLGAAPKPAASQPEPDDASEIDPEDQLDEASDVPDTGDLPETKALPTSPAIDIPEDLDGVHDGFPIIQSPIDRSKVQAEDDLWEPEVDDKAERLFAFGSSDLEDGSDSFFDPEPQPAPVVEDESLEVEETATEDVAVDEVEDGEPSVEEPPKKPEVRPAGPPIPPPRPSSYPERVALSAAEAIDLAHDYMQIPPPPDGVRWVKKESNRAGENDIILVRAATATGIGTAVLIPLILVVSLLWNTPIVQSVVNPMTPTRFLSLQEPTGTPTPLTTPTPSPGFTATPSQTPDPAAGGRSASPTPTPALRAGDPLNVQPTDIVLPGGSGGRAERDSALLIAQGEYEPAIATLQAERENLGEQAYNGNLYYNEVLALINLGEIDDARDLLEEAEERRVELAPQNTAYAASVAAARANLNLEQARQALDAGNPNGAASFLAQAEPDAREAIRNEPQWAEPYLLLIERYILSNSLAQAVQVIEDALSQPELQADLRFYVLRADIEYQRGQEDEADHQAALVLHADPASASAHNLRTRIAMDREDWSLASIYAQTYLFYHPLEVDGWVMLGEIRLGEGNPQLALQAFSRAIVIGENTPQDVPVQAYIDRADYYESQGQFALALADMTVAADTTEDPALRIRQMELAYQIGNYDTARQLLEMLRESDEIRGTVADYMEARLLASQSAITNDDFLDIARLIDNSIGSLDRQEQPFANALRARAYYETGDPNTALAHINSALNAVPDPSWYFLRAQIYEAQGNFTAAILEYERVRALLPLIPAPDGLREQIDSSIRRNENNILAAEATATAEASQ